MAQPTISRRQFGRDIARTRRLLKRLPETVQASVTKVYQEVGPAIEAVGKSQAPVKTGRLRSALRFRISGKGLRFEYGLIGRRLQRDLFYGYILEVGRKAGASRPFTRKLKSGKLTKRYTVQVKAISPQRYDFVFGRVRDYARKQISSRLKDIWIRALRDAAGGN